jgi:RHS repeat-associated protein
MYLFSITQVVVIDPVVMSMTNFERETSSMNLTSSETCSSHNYDSMKPIMVASWRLGSQSVSRFSEVTGIIAESRVLQEVMPIPNSNVKLIYHSGRARGYLSTIELRLTPEVIPTSLKTIHLRITIEGVLFEKTFEADPNLKYTYSWTRLNIYRQRVYGTTTAVVKVGYNYEDCQTIIWDVQTTKISGQDLTVSDVGGWDVDIHHRYNPQEGILYKGDGSNVFLRERPRLIFNVMGDGGLQRSLECQDYQCHAGEALDQKLLSPVAIVAGADGSLYVGDFNLIRRITPDGKVKTLLKLKSSGVAYRYHMTLNPHDDILYISDPESHQVIRLLNTEDPSDIEANFEAVIGSGIRCLPGDIDQCGDGGHATQARLNYPKGIAISADNQIYLADGTNIRIVDEDGIISTIIGMNKDRSWRPISCHGTARLEDVNLRWPSDLAINPLDNTLHFIDDNTVMKLTLDDQVEIVAGRPLHCHRQVPEDRDLASFASKSTLVSPQSLDFFGNGDMYLAESDSRRINRISVVSTDGRISLFAGKDSKCNCQDAECPCFNPDILLASESVFGSISSLAVSPDGAVFVADQANRRIRSIKSSIPELITRSQEYEVYSPESQEVFVFNRFGLHSETRNIPSGRTILRFAYSVSTSNGKLISISDGNGNKFKIMRDYSGQATAIENPLRQKFNLKLDRKRMLTEFSRPQTDNYTVNFGYTRSSELIRSRMDSDKSNFVYDYDGNGRLDNVVLPTGDLLRLESDLDLRGSLVNISLNGAASILSIRMRPGTVQDLINGIEVNLATDRGFVKTTDFGHSFNIKTKPYGLLSDESVFGLAESFPAPTSERTDIGRDTVSALEWQYFKTKQRSGKRLRINGETMMTVELNQVTESQIIMLESTQAILNVSESRISMLPSGLFASVIVERNGLGLPTMWRWGDREMSYTYDLQNRLSSILDGKKTKTLYVYAGASEMPEKVIAPNGGTFVFSRNNLGGLEYIMTPRGHIHGLSRQFSLSIQKITYLPPWSRQPYELHYDFGGRLVASVLPEQAGKVVYDYDQDHGSRLKTVLGDTRTVQYDYCPNSNLIKSIEVAEEGSSKFGMSLDMIYHFGLLKETSVSFDTNKDLILDDINIKYTYDGSARLGGITTQIGGQEPEAVMHKYNNRMGKLEGVKDLRIRYESLRKTVIQDITKSFSLTRDLDSYGRLEETVIRINGYEQFRLKLEYLKDLNLIRTRSTSLARGSPTAETFTYDQDLELKSVQSEAGQDWTYVYDINGNVLSVKRGEKLTEYVYDGGDRVAMVNSQEFVTYDSRGYVVKRGETTYKYNALAQMTSASEAARFSIQFYYDDVGRIVAKKDHRANVVQFVYANPYNNNSVTHVHYPKAARTYHMIYDDETGQLIAMDTPDSRYYVGTDNLGSPIAVFDSKGRLVKELVRSPFGQVVRDTNPSMDLSVDFAGGLIDQYTHLVHIGDRVYDPVLGQWMTPDWTKVASTGMTNAFDVFSYRFHNNDPVNINRNTKDMTGTTKLLFF